MRERFCTCYITINKNKGKLTDINREGSFCKDHRFRLDLIRTTSNRKMYPIIPHHVSRQIENKYSELVKTNKLKFSERYTIDNMIRNNEEQSSENNQSRVFALNFLENKSSTQSFSGVNVIIKKNNKNIYINCAKGYLQPEPNLPSNSWITKIRLSNEVHSANSILETNANRQIQLKLVKNIEAGQEVLLWFSQEVTSLMQIPFLTPINIQGQNRYICHICNQIYEYPNPLKIHIATKCGEESTDYLWNKINCGLNDMKLNSNQWYSTNIPFSPIAPERNPNWSTVHSSAFKQVIKTNQTIPYRSPLIPESGAAVAAHLETIVSNMGTSKQGHICIYCGKLYSRKYGLKIHIRTHTGFKPLKCKYCLRPFGDPSNLNKHVRLHSQGNSTYKCHLCDKILVRRRDLERHIQSRHTTNVNINEGNNTNSCTSEDD